MQRRRSGRNGREVPALDPAAARHNRPGHIERLALATMMAIALPAGAQERASVAPRNMQAIAPALAAYTDDMLFGDVWRRPGLQPRDRSLVTLSVLISTGKAAQLRSHLRRGLANGVTPAEIAGMTTHLAFYSGWPNAVSALNEIEAVFVERRIDTGTLRRSTGAARVQADPAAPAAPQRTELTEDVLFGDLWRRTDLTPRDRSLVTIAALAAGGDADRLALHLRRGLDNGLTAPEAGEAITHLAFYAGWPKALAADRIATSVVAGRRTAMSDPEPKVQVVPAGRSPVAGPAVHFTGSVAVASAFKGTGDARLAGRR